MPDRYTGAPIFLMASVRSPTLSGWSMVWLPRTITGLRALAIILAAFLTSERLGDTGVGSAPGLISGVSEPMNVY